VGKLRFRYGTVGSGKTLQLLAVAHSYARQDKKVLIIKPAMDTRFGAGVVKSRAGLDRKADILVEDNTVLDVDDFIFADCVLVDEAQFCSPSIIDQLRKIATWRDCEIMCFGLRTDFMCRVFPGSQRLFEVSDSLEELKTCCYFCKQKAIFNLRLENGEPTIEGPTVVLGLDDRYVPVCASCYAQKTLPLRKG